MKLAGKIALVTGAARGIGRGIAEVFAEEGADVAVNDIEITPEGAADDLVRWIQSQRAGGRWRSRRTSDRASVEAMFEKVWEELGPVDILVNNAGVETIVPFLEMTDEQWECVTDINLRGPWLCSQVFCRRVVAAGRKGNIVNIGSIQAAKILPGRTHMRRRSWPSKLSRAILPPK